MRRTHAAALAPALAIALGALLAGPLAAQQADEDNVKAIDDGGRDGGKYYWQVRCEDGKRASVILEDATHELCAHPYQQQPRCARATDEWGLKAAAEHACS